LTRPRLLSRRLPVRTLPEGVSDWTMPLPGTTTTPVVVDEEVVSVVAEVVVEVSRTADIVSAVFRH
jgi:hypothetical protein